MRIFHVSDTHLGYSAFPKLDPDRGINQREADFYDSYGRFIEIALKERPDVILHTGDLFDAVRPSNRAISIALEGIKKVADAGIRFIAISGNHETPRLRETGSVYRILDHLDNCSFAYGDKLERFDADGVEVMGVPHTADDSFKANLKELRESKKDGRRIVLFHAGWAGLDIFRMNEINELVLQSSDIGDDADYVALGHYHNHINVSKNCSYAGSTERLGMAEAGKEKGYIELDLEGKTKKFVKLPTRRMADISAIDGKGASADDLRDMIVAKLEHGDLDGAIVRMTLNGVSRDSKRGLDMVRIRKSATHLLNLELNFTKTEEREFVQTDTRHIGPLEEEFRQYLLKAQTNGLDKTRLQKIVDGFFSETEE